MILDFEELRKRIKKEEVNKSVLFTPQSTNYQELFESTTMPINGWALLSPDDVNRLYWIATAGSLAGKFEKKRELMDDVMHNRGFKFMAGGTNRMVYKHYEFPSIVAKVPIDKVGMNDNMAEMKNQQYIWPYCAKMLQLVGHIGFAERLEPILNRYQFNAFLPMIYLTTLQITGKYILEDIGQKYWKNWAVRRGWGVCLCDYPYLFKLDGKKLICRQLMRNGQLCGGEITFSDGYDYLYCTKCGRMYNATELQVDIDEERIEFDQSNKGGKKPMLAKLMRGKEVLASNYSSDSIVRPDVRREKPKVYSSQPKVMLKRGDKVLSTNASTIGNTAKIVQAPPTHETVSQTIVIPSIWEDPKPVEEAVPDNASIVAEVYNDPEVYKAEERPTMVIPEPTQEMEDKIAEEISKKFTAPEVEETPATPEYVDEVVEETAPKQESDEFPPNQWVTPPTFTKRPRRVITDSSDGSSNNFVQHRQRNPYRD